MSTTPKPVDPPPSTRFLTVDQAAEELNVSAGQVRSMLHSGQLRGIQVGGRHVWRIGRSDLQAYIDDAYNQVAGSVTGGDFTEFERGISPQMARAVQATKNVWRSMATEFGLLFDWEVSEAVAQSAGSQKSAADQRSAGNLLAVKRGAALRYPGFQIDRDTGTIRPVIRHLLQVAKDAGRSEEYLALWMVSPTGYLHGDRPVDQLDDPEALVAAARQAFNVQW